MKKWIVLLFHFSYWAFYLAILLTVFFILRLANAPYQKVSYLLSIGSLFVLLPSILGFYSFYHFLFKKYLQQRDLLRLLVWALGLLLLIAMTCGSIISLVYGSAFMFKDGYHSFASEMLLIVLIGLINGIIGFVLKGFISWYDDLKIKEDLQQSKYLMELELLKSKLDPHFLFNSINNIDGLMIRDVQTASTYLDKLSTILRFMLYESKEEKIPLTKELEYIQKYIDLQKIRTSNQDFVKYTVEGLHHQHQVPAMLFIPFIENAFKHVASKKRLHAIWISIVIEKEKILFQCKNNFHPNAKTEKVAAGVGNELINKRLQLIYPNQHELVITTIDEIYAVKLTILTHEN